MSYSSLTSVHSIQQQVQTETTGDGMGVERSWANTGDPILCRIQPMKQEQRITFRQAGLEGTHIVYLNQEPSTPYTTDHRFLFGTRIFQFRGMIDTDESARAPLKVIKMVVFEDSRGI